MTSCPWCKTAPSICTWWTSGRDVERWLYFVQCKNESCKINPISNDFETEQEAVEAWRLPEGETV